MGIFSGCLMLSDIDGTLLCNGQIPARNLKWIEHFKAEGGVFAIATGRALPAAKYSYTLSHSNAPVVACHGGLIYDYKTQKTLYSAVLSPECKTVLPKIMRQFPSVGVEVHSGAKIYELRRNAQTLFHKEYESLVFEQPPYRVDEVEWTKVLFAVDCEQTLLLLKEYCAQFSCCRFLQTGCSKKVIFFEGLPFGVNKGSALNRLKQLLGATRTLAIGDYYNDIEMIAAADFGATTAAAPNDIKSVAKFVTGSCEQGAVADFIIETEQRLKAGLLGN